MCALRQAKRVLITEYPDDIMLRNLERNRQVNIPPHLNRCFIVGHDWGMNTNDLLIENGGDFFDICLIADCIWMCELHSHKLSPQLFARRPVVFI
jgi:nicotinamide N-methyltransferase